jgi:hypothetical protein
MWILRLSYDFVMQGSGCLCCMVVELQSVKRDRIGYPFSGPSVHVIHIEVGRIFACGMVVLYYI